MRLALEMQAAGPALFDAADARGQSLGTLGLQLGRVAGSFAHLVDRSSEPRGTFGADEP